MGNQISESYASACESSNLLENFNFLLHFPRFAFDSSNHLSILIQLCLQSLQFLLVNLFFFFPLKENERLNFVSFPNLKRLLSDTQAPFQTQLPKVNEESPKLENSHLNTALTSIRLGDYYNFQQCYLHSNAQNGTVLLCPQPPAVRTRELWKGWLQIHQDTHFSPLFPLAAILSKSIFHLRTLFFNKDNELKVKTSLKCP